MTQPEANTIKIIAQYLPIAQALENIGTPNYKAQVYEFINTGGRNSGKTFQTLLLCIYHLIITPNIILQIIRRTDKQIRKQKINEVKTILNLFNYKDYTFNKGNLIFTLANGSLIILDSINDEYENPSEGGKIDLPIRDKDTKAIINFYEEATQLNPILVSQHKISTRANNPNCHRINFYCANPYGLNNWFNVWAESLLPPNKAELETKGFQFRYFEDKKTAVLRTNIKINENATKEALIDLEAIREADPERYKVVGLGMSGAVEGAIYQKAFSKRKPFNNFISGRIVGGYDYGWAKSDTYGCVGCIDLMGRSIKVIDEFRHNNLTDGTESTIEQIDRAIKFFKEYYYKYGKPITVYIDNAHLGDFYEQFNTRLSVHGLDRSELEFLPATKTPGEFGRAEITNFLLSMGYLQINDKCKTLINDLLNCHWEIPKNTHEGQKYRRSHDYTHGLNGFEYMILNWAFAISQWNPAYFTFTK